MNAALRAACERAQARLVERSAQVALVEQSATGPADLLRASGAANATSGRVVCSECLASAKPTELDGSGRCSTCRS